MAEQTNNLPAVSYYTPVELVGIYRSFVERGKSNGVVWLRGIYIQRPNQNNQWNAFYDELRDVESNTSITLTINAMTQQQTKMSQETIELQKQLAKAKVDGGNTIYIVIIVILIALLIISILL